RGSTSTEATMTTSSVRGDACWDMGVLLGLSGGTDVEGEGSDVGVQGPGLRLGGGEVGAIEDLVEAGGASVGDRDHHPGFVTEGLRADEPVALPRRQSDLCPPRVGVVPADTAVEHFLWPVAGVFHLDMDGADVPVPVEVGRVIGF